PSPTPYLFSLHDALPILRVLACFVAMRVGVLAVGRFVVRVIVMPVVVAMRVLVFHRFVCVRVLVELGEMKMNREREEHSGDERRDRKSTRLNSSHVAISY